MIRNGDTLSNNAWLTILPRGKIFTSKRMDASLQSIYYEAQSSKWARYEYNSARHDIQLIWWKKNKQDTLHLMVSFLNNRNQMEWDEQR